MSRSSAFSRRLLVASILLGTFVLFDIFLFGWLLLRSLSEREISRTLLEAREEVEDLARQIAGHARERGEDLYLAIATERETQTYLDSVIKQRAFVRTVEIRDREGKLVYLVETTARVPGPDGELLQPGSPELAPRIEQREVERSSSYDVYDLTVPIEDLGQIKLGISREELERRVEVLRQDLVRQAGAIGLVTVGLLASAFLVIGWLLRRGEILEEKAQEAERMAYLGTLAAGLAHEIRNPLNSLNLNMQMLEEEAGDCSPGSSSRRLLNITRGEIGRLEHLVSDFLAYARPRPLELERVQAADLLRHSLDVLDAQLHRGGARARVEEVGERPTIEADRAQMGQLLINLVQNALAATEEVDRPPVLVLRARAEGERVALEVEDNGPGILPDAMGKIFELFYSTRRGGTGLGLAIAQRIAQAHGGEIQVVSTAGEGTTMRVVVPAARPLPARATERDAALVTS